jgi:hypothetical protein
VWSNHPESYSSSSLSADRASHAGEEKGDDPEKKGYHAPPGWGMRLTTSPQYKILLLRSLIMDAGWIKWMLVG